MELVKRRRVLIVALAAAALATLSILATIEDGAPRRLIRGETLRIGYAIEAPYAFVIGGGEVTGESPEVAKRIAARLGIRRIDWVQTNFDALIAGLEAGRFDVIAAGMFITAERAERVAFSEPSFRVRQALLVRRGNPKRLLSYEDALVRDGVMVAVVAGAIEGSLLQRLGLPPSRMVVVPDALTGQAAVASGIADGLALSSPTIRWMVRSEKNGETEQAQPFRQPPESLSGRLGYGGFAFRREDVALRHAWNTALVVFIGSAEHRQLIAAFGFTEDELPGAVSTRDLLLR